MAGDEQLTRWERRGLILLALLFVLFGVLVEVRSCHLSRRLGDLSCYLRAAWAVRTGQDLYAITDHNGWHYNYPALLAILLVPLADPPPFLQAPWTLPFPVSAAIFYLLNCAALALGVHCLASALEERAAGGRHGRPPPGSRRWWALRVLPLLVCLVPIGHTLMRAQVSVIILALLCAMIAAAVRGRPVLAGVWLAAAACVKILPAFLLLDPLCRRDRRWLAGTALGLFAGLVLVPVAVFGPARAAAHTRTLARVVLAPGLGVGQDTSRAGEMLALTATHSQSPLVVIQNTLHPDPRTRPVRPSPAVRLVHWSIGLLLTLMTIIAGRRRRPDDGPGAALFYGALALNMLLLSPVCHPHYLSLLLPLVMGLLAARWESRQTLTLGSGLAKLFSLNLHASVVGQLPGAELLRDLGAPMYAALAVWAVGLRTLHRRSRVPAAARAAGLPLLPSAAQPA